MAQDGKHTENKSQDEHSRVKTILLVEDDPNIAEVLVQAITQETPFVVAHVNNGFEALRAVKGIRPDLFIFDYQLPQMDGIELYDQLHQMPELAHVPAIMMSARLPRKELSSRNILGMSKPLDLDEFLQSIEDFLL